MHIVICSVAERIVKNRRVQLETNNHSVLSLHYHLVFVVKYRRKVIDNNVSDRLKEIFSYIGANYHVTFEEWNHNSDHVHVLFKSHSKIEFP